MSPDEDVGFVTMGRAGAAQDVRTVGIGMLGYAFMGKAHTNALRKIGYVTWPPPANPRLVVLGGRNAEALGEAARRYGYERHTTDWREIVEDPDVELFDNGAPNDLHAEPTIAAAENGKHVVCEKPLGRTADEAYDIFKRVDATGVVHLCGFNYRFFPAIRLAKELIDAGELGEVHHFRGTYLQEWIVDPEFPKTWRLDKSVAGSGALGDLAAHVIDQARYLVGEIVDVSAVLATFVEDRPGGHVDVDDAVESVVRFANGAVGTIEATRFAPGRKNAMSWEINGSKGSVAFSQERMNELQVHLPGSSPGERAQGFRTVLVSEAHHPYWEHHWPHGHMIGWEDSFVHELHDVLAAITGGGGVGPHGATFEDGYRCAEVCDAMVRASESGRRQEVSYRP